MRTSKWFASILGIAVVAFGTSAFAAISWNFTSCPDATCTQTTSTITAKAYAWSTTANDSGGGSNNAMETAYLRSYGSSGLGVTNRDQQVGTCSGDEDCGEADGTAPEHAVDNNDRRDSILFTFSEAIKLTQVAIGWPASNTSSNDSDITVLRYAGTGTPTLAGQTVAEMVAAGWKLAGHYSDVADETGPNNTADVNAPAYESKYWLIGAYNSLFSPTGWTTGNDYVKFLVLAGTQTTQVPEPSTLLLFGIAAMAGLWRRRQYAHR
jgi:hypothetical protein